MAEKANKAADRDGAGRFAAVSRLEGGFFPYAMISPAFLLIILVIGFPLLYSLYVSFTPYELLKPNSLNFTLARALRNYQKLLNDDIFWRSLGNTIIFLAVSVNLSYVISLALSQLLGAGHSRAEHPARRADGADDVRAHSCGHAVPLVLQCQRRLGQQLPLQRRFESRNRGRSPGWWMCPWA